MVLSGRDLLWHARLELLKPVLYEDELGFRRLLAFGPIDPRHDEALVIEEDVVRHRDRAIASLEVGRNLEEGFRTLSATLRSCLRSSAT